jgi:hypothetical protein
MFFCSSNDSLQLFPELSMVEIDKASPRRQKLFDKLPII